MKTIKVIFLAVIVSCCVNVHANECAVMPIGVNQQFFGDVAVGESVNIDRQAAGSATNFSWLSWSGKNPSKFLLDSLVYPGNVNTYINPETNALSDLAIGNWVEAMPGARNSKKANNLVADIQGQEVVLPVWSESVGNGGKRRFLVSNFAKVNVDAFNLSGSGFLTLTLIGFTDCQAVLEPPVDQPEDPEPPIGIY